MTLLRSPGVVIRYTVAIVSVLVTALATRLLWTTGDHAVFPLFFAAVVFSAFCGGVGPSLVATVLSALIAELWLVPQVRADGAIVAGGAPVIRLAVFLIVAIVASALNVALRRAREEERRAKRLAEDANAARSRFVAMVTHELRTPLNLVVALSENLQEDPSLPAAAREEVRTILRNARLEARLVDDLLDVSRLTSGKLRLKCEPMDLRDAVRSAVRVCEPEIRQKDIRVELDLSSDPIPVSADAVRVGQIVWNLLRNAIKFTPAGGRVSLRAACDNGMASVSVHDTGIGIAPERLSEIFRAFEQESPDIAARFGGLGLGLSICRALAEAHGGVVTAASEGRGRGATFTLTLRAISAAQLAPAASMRVA